MDNEIEIKEVPKKMEGLSVFSDIDSFEKAQRMAKALCKSTLIPIEYRENIPNCLIAMEVANRVKTSALMVMQNLYIVYGKPGWSSQYIIAALNYSGKFEPLQFEMFGKEGTDSWGCRAWTRVIKTGERIQGSKITILMTKAEGWYQKKGSKWQTIPEVMLKYRAASFFGKLYVPEILIGFPAADELIDITAVDENGKNSEKQLTSLETMVKEEKTEIEPELKSETKKSELEKMAKKEIFPSRNPDLTEKQKAVMSIPEDIRVEAMMKCGITKLFAALADKECDMVLEVANFLAD